MMRGVLVRENDVIGLNNMAQYMKNVLPAGDMLQIEVAGDDPAAIEPYFRNEDEQMPDSAEFELPKDIGILPIRNAVAYPGTVTPLAIGRDKSKALLAQAETENAVIGLLTQRNPDVDEPRFKDLYKVGTAAGILKVIKMPQGTMHIVVHGLTRFKVVKPTATRPYLRAKVFGDAQPRGIVAGPVDAKTGGESFQ